MSYLTKTEYEIVPTESFAVIRNCSGCGTKTHYRNTEKFRVNANGNKLDVWLIYQCERCKHTLNLAVYERLAAAAVPPEEYSRFLSNDSELAGNYGKDFRFFQKNKAEVDFRNTPYQIVKRKSTELSCQSGQQLQIVIRNPHGLKIRPEKQLSECLGISASQVRKLLEQGIITLEKAPLQSVSACVKDLPEKEASVSTEN